MILSFALAIPHAPWIPERAANMARLRNDLGKDWLDLNPDSRFHTFDEKGPWPERSLRRWAWALKTGASHFVQLEDDVVVAPCFWRALSAMVTAWSEDVICLAATHSMAPLVAAQGRRSYLTPRFVGWGGVWPMTVLKELVAHAAGGALESFFSRPGKPCEDTFLAEFFVGSGKRVVHPVPTIVDHLHMVSTNGQDFDAHTNTQASVTWRGYAEGDLCSPDWWRTPQTYLPPEWTREEVALMGVCQWCGKKPAELRSEVTHVGICRPCGLRVTVEMMGFRRRILWAE